MQHFPLVCVAVAVVAAGIESATASAPALNFLVMADWGGSPLPPYTTTAEKSTSVGMGKMAESLNATFSLAVGDNFYNSGVTSVDSSRFKNTFEDVFTAPSLSNDFFKFYVIAGNHDHGGNVSAQIAYSERSSRWEYPESWYTFTEQIPESNATLQVVMVDTVILSGSSDVRHPETGDLLKELPGTELPGPASTDLADAQMDWLKQTLAQSTATYLIVAGHYPVWSICEHGPTPNLIQQFRPLFAQYHVTAYIAGHDHCIESFVDGEVDHHGMGASHDNDASTAHASAVPSGYLKFHTPGKSGGFGSFTVNATHFIARQHDGDGTLLYTAPPRGPRSQTPSPPPPPGPPNPNPSGDYDCHDNMDVNVLKLGLSDDDIHYIGSSDVSACMDRCSSTQGCVAIRWHKKDDHCHLLSGQAPSSDKFASELYKDAAYEACMKK